jgi:hypothetical protein
MYSLEINRKCIYKYIYRPVSSSSAEIVETWWDNYIHYVGLLLHGMVAERNDKFSFVKSQLLLQFRYKERL